MNITVLAGGLSPERDVSLKSGEMVAKALGNNGHNVVLIDAFIGIELPPSGIKGLFEQGGNYNEVDFRIGSDAPDLEHIKSSRKDTTGFFGKNVLDICRYSDIVFMSLHGADGENGKVQATFDLMEIRYTGPGYLSCALAMDKSAAKRYFNIEGIPTPYGVLVEKSDADRADISEIGFPCVIKPVSGGSSVGVTIAYSREEYQNGLLEAFRWEDKVLVEKYIKGREFSVGVIEYMALPVIEIVPKEGFYDYKNKYTQGRAIDICPAEIPDDKTKKMQELAVKVCRILGIDTYSRMDFIIEEQTGDIYCLEANTLPGMTPLSLVPQEAARIGISYTQLCEKIIEISLKKYER